MPRAQPAVLVVDQESDDTRSLIAFLRRQDLEVIWTRDGEGAFNAIDDSPLQCLITELRTPRIDGMALLRRARERNPEVCVVLIAERPDVEFAVEAMREGAYDFQVKPLNLEKLLAVLRRGFSHQALAARVAEIEGRLDDRHGVERLTGTSRAIQRIAEQVRSIAPMRATVLIEGEPGTGKRLVARAIHQNGPRKGERFVWADLGALAEPLFESELFGHERGETAGVVAPRHGRFEMAAGGTLYLDRIDLAPPPLQVKLVRVLRDRAFERVGGSETLRVDVRLITATGCDLGAEVERGAFRDDLLQRLGAVRIQMPPLRERREDIPLLAQAIVRDANREHRRQVTGLTRGLLERLARYPWPGNVRELKDCIERMVVVAEGKRPLDVSDLPESLRETESGVEKLEVTVGMTVAEAEHQLIMATLRHTGQDKTRAAAMLGIGLRTLYRKIKQYGIH